MRLLPQVVLAAQSRQVLIGGSARLEHRPHVVGSPVPRPETVEEGMREFVRRWTPILDACADCGIRYAFEVHPGQIAFDYHTADAAGQNMVTIATDAACAWIAAQSPVTASRWYIEANHSSDKKASSQSLMGTRGKKVVAEVVLDAISSSVSRLLKRNNSSN